MSPNRRDSVPSATTGTPRSAPVKLQRVCVWFSAGCSRAISLHRNSRPFSVGAHATDSAPVVPSLVAAVDAAVDPSLVAPAPVDPDVPVGTSPDVPIVDVAVAEPVSAPALVASLSVAVPPLHAANIIHPWIRRRIMVRRPHHRAPLLMPRTPADSADLGTFRRPRAWPDAAHRMYILCHIARSIMMVDPRGEP